jgi:hypothetical protein
VIRRIRAVIVPPGDFPTSARDRSTSFVADAVTDVPVLQRALRDARFPVRLASTMSMDASDDAASFSVQDLG